MGKRQVKDSLRPITSLLSDVGAVPLFGDFEPKLTTTRVLAVRKRLELPYKIHLRRMHEDEQSSRHPKFVVAFNNISTQYDARLPLHPFRLSCTNPLQSFFDVLNPNTYYIMECCFILWKQQDCLDLVVPSVRADVPAC